MCLIGIKNERWRIGCRVRLALANLKPHPIMVWETKELEYTSMKVRGTLLVVALMATATAISACRYHAPEPMGLGAKAPVEHAE